MVTVKRWTSGRCVICQRNVDGLECEFADKSLSGHLCMTDFKLAVRAGTEKEKQYKRQAVYRKEKP